MVPRICSKCWKNIVNGNRIIQDIAKKIEVNLKPEEEYTLSKSPEVNPEAYKAYMQGMFYWNKLTSEDLDTALKYFEIAREIDPDFALAYSGIATVWLGKAQQGLVSYAESNTIVKNNIAKAVAMDSTSADIFNIKAGILCWSDYNYEASEKAYRRSIKLNPNLSIARAYFSQVLIIRHKPEEAMKQVEMALKLDPFNSLYKALYGMNLNNTRQFDKAIEILEPTLISSPHDPVALSTLRTSYHMKGMYAKAIDIWKASYDVKNDKEAIEVLIKGYKDGGYQKSLENLALLLIKRSDSMYVTPWQIATIYTRAGKKDNALKWLEKAYEQHDGNMVYIGVDPIFDILKDDGRFSNLLKKMNLSVDSK
jgi:tetratricopeptide (TPR) repeat protein